MKVKLMNLDGTTQNGLVWGDGTRHSAANPSGKMELCSDTVIHFYDEEFLAVVMNPVHANFHPCIARRFEPDEQDVEYVDEKGVSHISDGKIISDGTKSGCRSGTTYELVTLPEISLNAKIHFGILCALQVYSKTKFVTWAKNWLNGSDRTRNSAYAAHAASAASAASAAAARTKTKIEFVTLLHQAIAAEKKMEMEKG